MEEYSLTTANGCINHIIDMEGVHYFIPNYCINDPYFEKSFEDQDEVKDETLNLTLFEITKNISVDLEVSTKLTGAELKELFREKGKFPEDKFTFRIFYAGNELKDDQMIGQHKIKDGFKLQVMKFNKSPSDSKPKEKEVKDVDEDEEKRKKKKKKHKKEEGKEECGEEKCDE